VDIKKLQDLIIPLYLSKYLEEFKIMITFGFDIDGVILDIHTHMIKIFKEKYNVDLNLHLDKFYFNIPGLSNEEISETVNQSIVDSEYYIQTYPTVKSTLLKISKITENPIYFITARKLDLKSTTEKSFAINFGNMFDYKIIFTGKSENKLEYIQKCNLDVFVEDNAETCNDISSYLKKIFLMNRQYNINEKILSNIIRINYLKDMLKYLRKE